MDYDSTALTTHVDATTAVGEPSLPTETASPGLPPRLGRYVPIELLGAGGMGQVYTAFDTELARRVAVKVLRQGPGLRAGINAAPRLRREARALAQLAHPNVVAIYDVGQTAGTLFVAMELVAGRTLKRWQAERPRSWTHVVDTYLQAGEGLAAAHREGLVHRDFKPDNAVIDDAGRVRVLDFGLAVAREDERFDAEVTDPGDGLTVSDRLTATGTVMGTPAYMAPEQLVGAEADARSDQFSFCVALFEALYGVRPFAGRSLGELGLAIAQSELQPVPADRVVPGWLHKLVLRGLRHDADQRWPDMRALLDAMSKGRGAARRRLRMTMVGTGFIVAAVAAFAAPRAVAADDPCESVAASVDEAWGPVQRRAVQEAIIGSDLPYAETTWEHVEPSLDAYAQQWSTERQAVCEAARVSDGPAAPQEHRVACLEGRRAELAALVQVLAEADASVVARAADAAARLPALSGCDDPTTSLDSDADPQRVAELRARLGQAHAFELAGRYSDARALALEIGTEADTLGDRVLIAEAQLRVGLLHERSGDYRQAETALERAAWLGVETQHDEVAAQAMVQLTGVVGYLQGRFDDGLVWGRHAQAAVRRADSDSVDRARLHNNLGATHDRSGDLAKAKEHYALALAALRGETSDSALRYRASTLNNLGNTAARMGDLDQARDDLRAAVAQAEALRGREHPEVAIMLANLANAELDAGSLDDAVRHHRRALSIRTAALGEEHPLVGSSLLNLGVALQAANETEQALPMLRRALELKEAAHGPDHYETALALNNLGEALRELGDPRAARAAHERARSIWTDSLGPDHPLLAFAATNLGLDLLAEGRAEEAIVLLEEAIALRERVGAEPALRGISRLGLAQAVAAQGNDPQRADALARAAWQDLADAPRRFTRERQQARAWLDGLRDDDAG